MQSISRRLSTLVILVVLGAGIAVLPMDAQGWGCWNCKRIGWGCNWLMDCNYACEAVDHNETGAGIYCEMQFNGLRTACFVSGGPCLNIEVEGEDPDCQDYCP